MIGPSPDRIANLIEAKIAAGALPWRDPYTSVTKAGRGDATCAACDHPIRPMAAECVCEFPFQPTLSFHFDCFREWREQANVAIDRMDAGGTSGLIGR
jgi:hypothetical protein